MKNKNTYKSLLVLLEGYWDRSLSKLPKQMRLVVEKEYFPITWGMMDENGRKNIAAQIDAQKDPRYQEESDFWSNFYQSIRALRNNMRELELKVATTPLELESKSRQLKLFRRELRSLELVKSRFHELSILAKPYREVPEQKYIPFNNARALLEQKFEATTCEIAAWIVFREGRLVAYKHANGLVPPIRFFFQHQTLGDDYVAALLGAWFGEVELDNFQPTERYIEGRDLIARWEVATKKRAKAFIVARILEFRLEDLHPISGITQGSDAKDESLPPIEDAIFSMSQVSDIEDSEFADMNLVVKANIGSAEHRKEIAQNAANVRHAKPGGANEKRDDIRKIWASGKYSSRDRCAEEECRGLEMAPSTARKALINTPGPTRNT
jgi:hypothetical protein